jgi:uncharacterized protein YcbK (DUF882 family)
MRTHHQESSMKNMLNQSNGGTNPAAVSPLANSAFTRRRLLRGALAAVIAVPSSGLLSAGRRQLFERSLKFYNVHTGESIKTVYWALGNYIPDALSEVSYVLRDYRTGEVKTVEPGLLDLLHRLAIKLNIRQPFYLLSGYRSPATNAMLAAQGYEVSVNSLHMDAMAADIYVPGRSLSRLHAAAIALHGGGVGYYLAADFVHVDVGRVRYWRG